MDKSRKPSSKLKIQYGFNCIECASDIRWFSTMKGRDRTLSKHKEDTGHKETYRCMSEQYSLN